MNEKLANLIESLKEAQESGEFIYLDEALERAFEIGFDAGWERGEEAGKCSK